MKDEAEPKAVWCSPASVTLSLKWSGYSLMSVRLSLQKSGCSLCACEAKPEAVWVLPLRL